VQVAEREPVDAAKTAEPPAHDRSRWVSAIPLLLGLVTILCAVALPFAPVEMSRPVVSWPEQPTRPASTMLELTNRQPLSLDVGFSCAAVRAAAATADGVLVSTIVPGEPAATQAGLLVTARGGVLQVLDRSRPVFSEPVRPGDCRYTLAARAGRLTVARDGAQVGLLRSAAGALLPDVDVLATSIRQLPGAADLRVTVRVDDQFNTTPTPAKQVLVVVLLLSALGSLGALWRLDRRVRAATGPPAGAPEAPRARLPGVRVAIDVVVVATVLLWWFIAPQTDDDGYYAAMARNSPLEGFVGNYYQLLNQSFTPFTWFYRVLGWWEHVGDSRVLLRVPAVVGGLLTWAVVRRVSTRPEVLPAALAGRRWGRPGITLLAAAAFLAWWLPYAMGVRPEGIVGLLAVATLACVVWALRRQWLLPLGLGLAFAGLAIACHPTGFVALAPFLAAIRQLGPLVWRGGARAGLTRLVLVLAPGAFPVAASFADGTLNDFLRGQEIFLSIAGQNSWYDEYQRYNFLLSPAPMGSYAKRVAVLLALVALLWFLVLAVMARARDVRLPSGLVLSGRTLGLAFLLLWLTPSKWTHHFGAVAGLGAVFLAVFIGSAPGLVREVTGGRRAAWTVPVGVLGSGVVVFALSFQGPNQWAYNWLAGMPHANVPPYLSVLSFNSLRFWLVVVLLAVGAVRLWRRRDADRRGPSWLVAVPLVVLVFLTTSVGYLVASFGYASVRTLHGYSPGAAALTDPLARNCDAAGALDVYDIDAARPAAVAVPAPAPAAPSPFVAGGGWLGVAPPPSPAGSGVAQWVWGSLPTAGAEDLAGSMTSPWFALPDPGADARLAILVSGRLDKGDLLTVEYGTQGAGGQPTQVRSEAVQDTVDDPSWRTVLLDVAAARTAGATVLRLVADDRSAGIGGWMAFTGPSVLPLVPLERFLPRTAPVAISWQTAFLFPCQRQPRVRFGITEPSRYGIIWSDNPQTNGLNDSAWRVDRGGLFGPILQTSSMTALAGLLPSTPGVQNLQVQKFTVPYPAGGYHLRVQREHRFGWQGPQA
jgi:hypothetical protein